MAAATPQDRKRHKTFARPKKKAIEPPTFDLWDEEYTCYKEIHGRDLLLFSKGATSEDTGDVADALLGFFETVLIPDSYAQIQKLWDDKERVVSMEELTEIVGWLVEQYSDYPTE